MAYTNSPLVDYVRLSPNHSGLRKHSIDTITIHCVVGQLTVETVGSIFAPTSRQASSNYAVGRDGRIGMYVEEKNRSWCTSSSANDNRAVTIEVACDPTHPYTVNSVAYASLIRLVADICRRNGIKKLLWEGNKALIGNVSRQNMTVHRWFASTACPGDYLYNKHPQIANDVNKLLGAGTSSVVSKPDVTGNYTGEFPILPARGYFKLGDGYETLTSYTTQIKNLQKFLNWCINAGLAVDGDFGPATNAAVIKYQKTYGLEQDGWFGPACLAKAKTIVIKSGATQAAPAAKKGYSGEFPVLPIRGYYCLGDGYDTLTNHKEHIKRLQKFLNWAIGANLVVDGNFGPKTEAAVMQYQTTYNLVRDGWFGPKSLEMAKSIKK